VKMLTIGRGHPGNGTSFATLIDSFNIGDGRLAALIGLLPNSIACGIAMLFAEVEVCS